MRYPAEETALKHARILVEASKLYRERGLAGVSVGEVMKASGLTHGPFYNHFESKQALIAECVEHISNNSIEGLASTEKSEAGKTAYRKGYLSTDHRDDTANGCVIAALAVEISREPAARAALTTHIAKLITKMTSHFPWSSKRKARSEAIREVALMVGAMVLARAVDDEALSEEILHGARQG